MVKPGDGIVSFFVVAIKLVLIFCLFNRKLFGLHHVALKHLNRTCHIADFINIVRIGDAGIGLAGGQGLHIGGKLFDPL